jgi:hypothetical protein
MAASAITIEDKAWVTGAACEICRLKRQDMAKK